jgi:hypothetical protein
VEQLAVRHHLAGVAREQGEHAELDRRQVDRPAVDRDLVARLVDPDRPERDHRIAGDGVGARVAERDPDPGEQLAGAERLGQLVVRAGVERDHLVVLAIARG